MLGTDLARARKPASIAAPVGETDTKVGAICQWNTQLPVLWPDELSLGDWTTKRGAPKTKVGLDRISRTSPSVKPLAEGGESALGVTLYLEGRRRRGSPPVAISQR
jgi:hypothetical protein